jgi:peptidoglycan/LPS O-acetylase OafA/YrhL
VERLAPGFGASASKVVSHHEFRPDINGLRALAVLSVLGFHAGLTFLPGGFAGVDIFFVISGFLISRIILSEREAGAFSFADFYGKRVKRILPALLMVLAASWVMGFLWLTPADFRGLGGHMEASSYFSVNLWLYRNSLGPAAYFNPNARYMPLLHLWSLSIEEQFYLVWPALLLLLFKARRFIAPGIAAILLASLAFCIYQTNINSTAAFFFLSTRAWELALGALLAWREVFVDPPQSSPGASNFRVAAGLALMLAGVVGLSENMLWPGYLALIPTLGCALVIASPGAQIGGILLGNRFAQFFGRISYPLYLWHWPLLSFAHHRFGDHLPLWMAASLLALATLLAFLTWKFIESPIAATYKKRPLRVAAPLLAVLAVFGLIGSVTRQNNGFPQRFPAPVIATFNYFVVAAQDLQPRGKCSDTRPFGAGSLEEERRTIHAFYRNNSCLTPKNPDLPTVVLLGDSHALHLVGGMEKVYAGRANILLLGAGGCAPLIAQSDWRAGWAGTTRCQAINEEIVGDIVALKPAAIVVSAYFDEFYHSAVRPFPGFLKDFDANVAALRAEGVKAPVFVMGEVPTWSPGVPTLVGRAMLAGRGADEFSRDNINPGSLETDALFSAHAWGEGVVYLSQAKALCGERGCRRLIGPNAPEDMVAFDYGHYTPAASVYAVKTILASALDPALASAR